MLRSPNVVFISTLAARERSFEGPPRTINNLLAYLVRVLVLATRRGLLLFQELLGLPLRERERGTERAFYDS